MHSRPRTLHNTATVEAWPAWLLRARGNQHARILARASHVLRRKHDGRYLAAVLPQGVVSLQPQSGRVADIDSALAAIGVACPHARHGLRHVAELPLDRLQERLGQLGLDEAGYSQRTGLPLVAEPGQLAFAGFDRYRRALWLHADTAQAWNRMRQSALRDAVVLEAISGYRSHDYQLGIFERKLARGQRIDQILTVNAAPGFSEHHSGRALDIGAPDEPPAEESFESTAAFAWLRGHAGEHGFVMSYPRDNPHGIVYEPWHWMHRTALP